METYWIEGFKALILSMFLTLLIGKFYIPWLRRKKVGQNIREEGPKSHYAKQGTPTMGGVMMIAAVLITAAVLNLFQNKSLIVILSMLLFGMVGFIDDYFKLILKRSLGLDEKQKIIMQIVFSVILLILYRALYNGGLQAQHFPFVKKTLDFSFFIYPMMVFIFVDVVNAVNLTDGLDGLAGGVSLPIFFTFAVLSFVLKEEVATISLAIAGAVMGFLFYNANPASVYMGDTGSMALGGAVAGLALTLDFSFYLPFLGGIFMTEALSVLIQMFYFRRTGGKRVFLMTPLHHHYELKGYKEPRIVSSFTQVSILLCVITLLIFFSTGW